jgi:hypothetical protein
MARRKRVTRRFPLESPNWIPIVNAHQSLCGVTGNRQLAAKDLTNALADRDVPSMRRCFLPERRSPPVGAVLLAPDGELLPAAYWTEHEVVQSSLSDATIVARRSMPLEIAGYAYFVWKPALAKIWPAAFALAAAQVAPRVRRTNDKRQHRGSPTQDAIRQIAAQEWPDGHEGIPIKHIIAGVSPKLRARSIPVPERDTWLRALGAARASGRIARAMRASKPLTWRRKITRAQFAQ